MSNFNIHIDTEELKKYAEALRNTGKYDLVNAVKFTLNDMARDLKMNTMPKSASVAFVNRSKNFFKANSTFTRVNTDNIKDMKSTFGFTEHKLSLGQKNHAVENLEKQEEGGNITNKTFIALKKSRIGGDKERLVQRRNWLNSIDDKEKGGIFTNSKVRSLSKRRINSEKALYVQAIIMAGKGGYFQGTGERSSTIFRVNKAYQRGRKNYVSAVYSKEKGRSVNIKTPKHFVQKAASESHERANEVFMKNFEDLIIRRFKRRAK